jgi:hypothetical protein
MTNLKKQTEVCDSNLILKPAGKKGSAKNRLSATDTVARAGFILKQSPYSSSVLLMVPSA